MMLRRLSAPMGFVGLAVVGSFSISRQTASCNKAPEPGEKKSWPFDAKGLATKIAPMGSQSPLYLVGAGLRRKNLYIVEVDVYLVGLGLSENGIKAAQEWASKKDEGKPLSTFVLNSASNIPAKVNANANEIKVAIVLRLVRSVTNAQFIEAFREAFAGLNPSDFDEFRSVVDSCVGEKLNVGDEFAFYLTEGSELVVAKNGKIGGKVNNPAMTTRLLDVYSDPKRVVSKELYQSLEQNIPVMGEKLRNKDTIFANN